VTLGKTFIRLSAITLNVVLPSVVAPI